MADSSIAILAFLRKRKELGASTEEIADALHISAHPNARRRFYYRLTRMVVKKQITKQPQGKRLWRFFA